MSENEPFVDAEIGAKFLSVSRRLLELARSAKFLGIRLAGPRGRDGVCRKILNPSDHTRPLDPPVVGLP